MKVTGVILAGGESRRMGLDKALIEVAGAPMIERAVDVLKGLFEETFIVANRLPLYEWLGVRVFADLRKGMGSLGGLHTALFHAGTPYVFIAACDMPCLDPDVIRSIIKGPMKGYDAAVPFVGGRLHPLHALYSRNCFSAVEKMLDEGNLRITDLLSRIRTKRLDEGSFKGLSVASSLSNVNTREDLENLKRAL